MKIRYFLSILVFLHTSYATASVVLTGTRIIFPSYSLEKTIQLKNSDNHPYIVQVNVTGDTSQTLSSVPFVIVPPVFRMEPNQGQSVRIIALDTKKLPSDRESVFYLNFTQLPAIKSAEKNNNQLIIALTSRVKIFFRPESMTDLQSEAYKHLTFSFSNGRVIVDNPTGFYISLSKASFSSGNVEVTLAQSVMLPPKSKSQWLYKGSIHNLQGGKIKLTQVNDYGAYVSQIREL